MCGPLLDDLSDIASFPNPVPVSGTKRYYMFCSLGRTSGRDFSPSVSQEPMCSYPNVYEVLWARARIRAWTSRIILFLISQAAEVCFDFKMVYSCVIVIYDKKDIVGLHLCFCHRARKNPGIS